MLAMLRSVSPLLAAAAVLAAAAIAPAAAAPAREDAFVILSRSVLTPNVLENHNMTLSYSVHNAGAGTATDLVLVDKSFPRKRFTLLDGTFSKSWPSLAPGATVSTTVDLESTRAGTFYTHPAELTYKPSADGAETTTTSASDATISVEDMYTFNKRTDMHVTDWIMFVGASVLTIFGPYFVYASSARMLNLSDPVAKKKQ